MTVIEVDFDEKANEKLFLNWIKEKLENEKISLSEYLDLLKQIHRDKPEPLRMEHFHLPLGMWFVGILLSVFCFLAEIIKKCINIRKSNKLRAGRLSDTEEAEGTQVQDIEDTED